MSSLLPRLLLASVLATNLAIADDAKSLFVTLPDWNDEDAAYEEPSRGLVLAPGPYEHIEGGNYSPVRLSRFGGLLAFTSTELHEDTEGDDLWAAYHMWKRLEGIKPNSTWRDRMNNLKDYYVNDYLGVLTGPGREIENSYDHLYGWGLCDWYKTEAAGEPDRGAAALRAINDIVAAMVAWADSFQGGKHPGDVIFNSGSGGRRWARQLRFAVAAAEVSPTPTNLDWRNRVIGIVLQDPDFDPKFGMHFYERARTISLGWNYDGGDRIANTFHMGIWMDALWHAWRVLDAERDSRAAATRQRLIGMATYYRDYGREADGRIPLHTGLNVNTGVRLDTSSTGYGSLDVYTIAPINGLVFAYKFTGMQSYLDAAWALWLRFHESETGQKNTIGHYADSQLSSANGFRLLRHNKGELQYVYALFEHGGKPTRVSSGSADSVPPLPPSELHAE